MMKSRVRAEFSQIANINQRAAGHGKHAEDLENSTHGLGPSKPHEADS
jgi:hypothetical protein